MSATYESLSPNGHFNLAKRIFQKVKSLLDGKVQDLSYTSFEALPTATKNNGTIWAVYDAPDEPVRCQYNSVTKTLYFNWGAMYDSETNTLVLR
jgi:hypothetical protein